METVSVMLFVPYIITDASITAEFKKKKVCKQTRKSDTAVSEIQQEEKKKSVIADAYFSCSL